MFFRFLGRIVFYSYILPAVGGPVLRMINAMLKDWVNKEYDKMSPADKRRFDSAGTRVRRLPRHYYMPPMNESAGNHRCIVLSCGAMANDPIHLPLLPHSFRNPDHDRSFCTKFGCGQPHAHPIHSVTQS